MEVHHSFSDAMFSTVDLFILFSSPPAKSMYTQQVSVFGLDDMFFGIVTKQCTEVDEVRGVTNRSRDSFYTIVSWNQMNEEKAHISFWFRPSFLKASKTD